MVELGENIGAFAPEKTGLGLFGNPVRTVAVHKDGLELERKKGTQRYRFGDIEKITAKNYASPTPTYIFISVYVKGEAKPIEFSLHPNKREVNLLLGVFSDYLLGADFHNNLETLSLELGGLGTPLWLRDGALVLGEKRAPLADLESFTTNRNGFYDLKVRGLRHKLAVSPDYAPNILASIKVLTLITERNRELS